MEFFNKIKSICFDPQTDILPDSMAIVEDSERVVRFLLSPLHFKNNSDIVRSNIFNPTKGTDEISVSRLEVLSIDKTKPIAKAMVAKHQGIQQYKGFALHTKAVALDCGVKDIISKPSKNNIAHAEMKIGVVREGEEIPAEMQEIKDNLRATCKVLIDPNPDSDKWTGDEPIYNR